MARAGASSEWAVTVFSSGSITTTISTPRVRYLVSLFANPIAIVRRQHLDDEIRRTVHEAARSSRWHAVVVDESNVRPSYGIGVRRQLETDLGDDDSKRMALKVLVQECPDLHDDPAMVETDRAHPDDPA